MLILNRLTEEKGIFHLANQTRNFNRNVPAKDCINAAIRAPRVLCIEDSGKNLGVIPTSEALLLATNSGLDLVLVSPAVNGKPPTCKIMDYGKHKYEESKKAKAAAKRQRETEIETKEIKFRPTTDTNDLKTKARKAMEIIEGGDQVRVIMTFKGRQLTHKEIGEATLQEFITLVPDAEVGQKTSSYSEKALTISVLLAKKLPESVKKAI